MLWGDTGVEEAVTLLDNDLCKILYLASLCFYLLVNAAYDGHLRS